MDSYIREIVTLQIGHYSNFIGSHWLNLQESSFVYNDSSLTGINNDYLFREGKLHSNEQCYTPRLLIIDAKGSLRSLPQAGTLYEPSFGNVSTSQALWSGDVNLVSQMPEEKNEYLKYLEMEDLKYAKTVDEDKDICSVADESSSPQNCEAEKKIFDLSSSVNVWSDFLGTHLHPKTIYLLDDFCHQDINADGSSPALGWCYQEGVTATKREKNLEEINDRIRHLAESCGSLQGFHLLCDAHDGMGGVGAMVAELLTDEYSSKDVFSFLSHPPHYKPASNLEQSTYLTNVVQCYTKILEHSSLVLPLSLRNIYELNSDAIRWPYLTYKENVAFDTSSLFSSFLDTISVPWRSKSNPIPMTHIAHILTPLQRKVIGGGLSFPIGLEEDQFLEDWLAENQYMDDIHKKVGLKSVSGAGDSNLPRTSEIHSVRGISINSQERTRFPQKRLKFADAWQLLEHHLTEEDDHLKRRVSRFVSGVKDPLKFGSSFPHIFKSTINTKGYLKKTSKNMGNTVESTSSIANLYQGEDVAVNLRNIFSAGRKINVSKLPELLINTLEKDIWDATMEELLTLINTYREDSDYALIEDSGSD